MQPHIAFLHTSPVHVETFTRLLSQAAPGLRAEHIVDEALLADAQRAGAADPSLVARVHDAMAAAAGRGAGLVVCTCSTIGGAAERTPTAGRFKAARIDRAMADRAVELGPKVLVVVALESTLGPTTELLMESAAAAGAGVDIRPLLVEGAWAQFMGGDRDAYVRSVADAVRAGRGDCDVVVLAQASMAPAAQLLAGLGVEVLSSPGLGVQAITAHFA